MLDDDQYTPFSGHDIGRKFTPARPPTGGNGLGTKTQDSTADVDSAQLREGHPDPSAVMAATAMNDANVEKQPE